ncbi:MULTISPECIES: adenylate/guanylate cyclase domain-containing protein [unclassified Ensifer]|uniref:adenylate/guanylate cyclase domain-containing protein n=1 Tax=unclassified Ensifer TaxID=2633371 RepID=UPI0009C4C4AC|nr:MULTISPECIES: adenylate/guanylate cyclase domain-containing protein [unclassified Ensifer]OMQ44120.1 adenylate cyclase [Ensifer sp. 1H6]PSS59610.1 adenylate/guanylate cyclase domain-containing protein [Ensifer sp. NM-2]
MQRKLVAIMVADFVGSTAAMESHEEEAVECVSACLKAVGDTVARHDGRVFNTAGDAVLAEFTSPVNALRAAMEARSSLAAIPDATPNHMRFGLHLADVLAVGDDLRGNGVNLAARLQSSAAAGEIEVSQALYEQVRRVSPCAFEEIGERRFKGVSEPMRVYRVGTTIDRHRFLSAPTREAPPAAMRPNSVIVTPFVAFAAGQDDQSFLTEGLTDDLTLELGRLKSLFVSSRSASVVLAIRDPVEVGRALGVRYVVSGSVRKLGSLVRLNVSLCETTHGHLVWSDRIERPFEELLAIIDEVTARIAATVAGRIEQAELVAARLKRPDNMSAYEYYLLGLDHHRLIGVADRHIGEAMHWFERSMDADPTFGRPVAMHVCAWSNLPDFDLSAGEQQVAHALDLDPTDPDSHRIMGAIKCMEGDFAASRHHHERAIDLAPNDAYIAGRCAAFYTYANEAERALELLDRAEMLDPFLPVWIVEERVASLYVLSRHDELFAVARALPYQTRRTLIYRIAARMARGDIDRARQLVAQIQALDPKLTAGYIRSQEFFRDRTITEALVDRVHAAGLPLA